MKSKTNKSNVFSINYSGQILSLKKESIVTTLEKI